MSTLQARLRSFLIVAILVFTASGAHAALTDAFLQIPEAPGESQDSKHPGWISLESYNDTVSGGARGFSFSMSTNRAFPKLLTAATTGQILKLVTLEVRKAGTSQMVFLNVKFENVRIANVTTGYASASGTLPIVNVSFTCDRATWAYTPQKADGSPDAPVIATVDFKAPAPAPIVLPEIPRNLR